VYESFFGFREPAFALAPDPRRLCPFETHEEGLATLLYGITRRKGFLLLTGDVGVGKTTLLRAAIETLPRSVDVAFILNTHRLGPDDLLEVVMREFSIPDPSGSRIHRLYAVADFLVESARQGRNNVLVVDEAHNLGPETLEEIRLLSNYETQGEKLLQIVLCGQSELRQLLERPELRPLRQRIALEHHLVPLKPSEVHGYLNHRLNTAGSCFSEVFEPGVENVLYSASRGYPRVLNLLADRLLLSAFAKQLKPIPVEFAACVLRKLAQDRRDAARAALLDVSQASPSGDAGLCSASAA
jgi:general secretion pathway protein A